MKRRPRWLYPPGPVYILAHAVLFLIGFTFVLLSFPLHTEIGSSLIAAAIAGWVVFVYVLFTQTISDKLAILTDFGFVEAFEARAARIRPEYDRRLAQVQENVDVLGFGLRALREDYADQFARWRERANVRILLLDPRFPADHLAYSEQRDSEEMNAQGTIRSDVRQFVRTVGHLMQSPGHHSFEVRLYRCLPSVNIFRVDDDLFWGPYLIRQQSRNTPTFVVRRGGILFSCLTQHFQSIWGDDNLSGPIPQPWLDGD